MTPEDKIVLCKGALESAEGKPHLDALYDQINRSPQFIQKANADRDVILRQAIEHSLQQDPGIIDETVEDIAHAVGASLTHMGYPGKSVVEGIMERRRISDGPPRVA